jgi:hypothetical protein
MSEELEGEDESPKDETNFAMPIIPKGDNYELEISNLNDIPSSLSLDEESSKEQFENPLSSQDPNIEESQDEEDLPIILHAKNIGRKNGNHVPFFISLRVNEFTLYNCMLDSGSSMNIIVVGKSPCGQVDCLKEIDP